MFENWHEFLDDAKLHELCKIFPPMNEEEYDGLVASMKKVGYLSSDPITLVQVNEEEYQILDGRNRLMAAADAGVTPDFVVIGDGIDLHSWVMARNTERRMLSAGQRAAIASKMATLKSGSVPSKNNPGTTVAEAASVTGASATSIAKYRHLEAQDDGLAEKVALGEMSLNQAITALKPAKPDPAPAKPDPAPAEPDPDNEPLDLDEEVETPAPVVPEPAGSLQPPAERTIEYTAWWDPGLGKVCVRMGDEKAVWNLRKDTALALSDALNLALGEAG